VASAAAPSSGGQASGGSSSGSVAAASGSPSDIASIAAKVDPALVDINTTLGYQSAEGAGTGLVVSSNGEVLTNNHVIDGATKITATDVGTGETYTATVVGYDPSHDIAVLQLRGASGLKTVTLGDSSGSAVGQAVVGIGNAGGAGGTPSSAAGSITALNQSITAMEDLDGTSEQLSSLIETNADIQPGDSGGPLVNDSGQVIGIDTAGSDSFSFQTQAAQAYAIPINEALAVAKQIEAGDGSATAHVGATAFLGIGVAAASLPGVGEGFGGFGGFGGFQGAGSAAGSAASGITVSNVIAGEPAAKAGLTAGDVVTSLDGHRVQSETQLSTLLLGYHPSNTVTIGWTDTSGQAQMTKITLGSGPPA
jgi:S1-C subfamily serine protease